MTFDIERLVITVEKDVPKPRRKSTRGIDLENDDRVLKLRAMAMGDSFFMEGAKRADCRQIINLAKKVDVFLMCREVDEDEVYQVHGCRLWRVEESELPRRGKKAAAPKDVLRYWHHPESECVMITGPGHGPHFSEDNPGDGLVEEIDKEAFVRLQDKYNEDF